MKMNILKEISFMTAFKDIRSRVTDLEISYDEARKLMYKRLEESPRLKMARARNRRRSCGLRRFSYYNVTQAYFLDAMNDENLEVISFDTKPVRINGEYAYHTFYLEVNLFTYVQNKTRKCSYPSKKCNSCGRSAICEKRIKILQKLKFNHISNGKES